jgi:hypothetical protein
VDTAVTNETAARTASKRGMRRLKLLTRTSYPVENFSSTGVIQHRHGRMRERLKLLEA